MLIVRGLGVVDYLSFGNSRQYHLRPLVSNGQDGSCSGRIEADRPAEFRVPELGVVEWGHPRSLHDADPSVLALDSGLVAAPSENQNLCFVGDGLGCCASGQSDLGIAVRHEI